MSPRGNGVYYGSSPALMKWEEGRNWALAYTFNFHEVWTYRNSGNGWEAKEEDYEGAALVAPLSVLFWED